METLKIEIPKGHVIDSFDLKSGLIKFKEQPKNVTERIKTVADILADHGLTQKDFDMETEGLTPDEKAYRLLKLLTKSLNQGWEPNWSNDNEYKYFSWFYMAGSSGFRFNVCDGWHSSSFVGSRLCFKTRELAEHAGKNFTEVYKQFMLID